MELGPIFRAVSRNKFRFLVIAAQLAVTLAIVANCTGLILDARRKMSHPPAFDDENLIHIEVGAVDPALLDDDRKKVWHYETIEQLRGIEGVRFVSSTTFWPWWAGGCDPMKPVGKDSDGIGASTILVDESFPDAVGAEIDEGRWFSRDEVERATDLWQKLDREKRARDGHGKLSEPIVVDVVVSRAFGKLVFGDGPLLGKLIEDSDGDILRIIGVIRRFYAPSPLHCDENGVFLPKRYYQGGTNFIVRSEPGSAAEVGQRIEEWMHGTGVLPFKAVRLASDLRDMHYGHERMMTALMALLLVLLLITALLGIAGLTSFSVTERTRQIGIRRALGASATDILRYFLTESALVTTIGLMVGAGLAVLLNMALLRVFDGAKLGPGTVAASALLLWFVAIGAALPPALRASRISPAIATRNV